MHSAVLSLSMGLVLATKMSMWGQKVIIERRGHSIFVSINEDSKKTYVTKLVHNFQ
jgi:hypothetical protein